LEQKDISSANTKIKIEDLILVPVKEIKRDPSNPNIMKPEQMAALERSMLSFGDVVPIILDQNKMIADGEHRLDILMKYGFQQVPCFIVNLKTDEERRMLRQVMNKLHGSHDPEKDVQEIRQLYDKELLPELSKLLAKDEDHFLKVLSKSYDDIPYKENNDVETGEIFQVVVECKTAEEQEDTFNKLVEEGFRCKVLTL